MNIEQLLGSQTAKNGFKNEDEIVIKFNNWQIDEDAQKWLTLIDELIKIDAEENISNENETIPQWQQNSLDKELESVAQSEDYAVSWDSVKDKFKQP